MFIKLLFIIGFLILLRVVFIKTVKYQGKNFYVCNLNKSMDKKSVSFTSNINFVDRLTYCHLPKKNKIGFWHNVPNILKADQFYSEEIRTCTGGGLVVPFKEAEGFHFWDDNTNKKNFLNIANSLFRFVKNPERGLLIGSKTGENYPYSIEQFERFKKIFFARVKNISLFERHRYANSQTHYHYSLDKDTWTLFSEYRKSEKGPYIQVKDLKTLRECFCGISIADGDKLFIRGKEISSKDVPELFQNR